MIPVLATPGAHGFDCDFQLNITSARDLKSYGYQFAVRYVSLHEQSYSDDITINETTIITAAGLALMLVQHCSLPTWRPYYALGRSHGEVAANNAVAVGYPIDASLWLDLENMRPDIVGINAYVNAWCKAVTEVGYKPGVYFSADNPLKPKQIYFDWITTQYWRGLSRDTPDVYMRGFCMQQYPDASTPYDIDRDVITPDAFGGVPTWSVA